MKNTLIVAALIAAVSGAAIVQADPDHKAGGGKAGASKCAAATAKKKYKVSENSSHEATPKPGEIYELETYGTTWVMTALAQGGNPPPDFYARGTVRFSKGCKVAYYTGEAYIDGHAGHVLHVTPADGAKELIADITSLTSHAHGATQPMASMTIEGGMSVMTHNGQVHWDED